MKFLFLTLILIPTWAFSQLELIGPNFHDFGTVTEDDDRITEFRFINKYKFSLIPNTNINFDISSQHTPTLAKSGDTVLYRLKLNINKTGPYEDVFYVSFYDILDTIAFKIKANVKSFDYAKNMPLDAFERKLRTGDEKPQEFPFNLKIVDKETGKPIKGALVSFSANSVPYKNVKSDENGNATRVLHNGYAVNISATGYSYTTLNISLGCNDGPRVVELPKHTNEKSSFEYHYEYEAETAIKSDVVDSVLMPSISPDDPIFEPLTDKDYVANNIVFLMDVSGSMTDHNRFELLKESMLEMIGLMREKDLVTIISFSDQTRIIVPPTHLNATNIASVKKKLAHLESGGMTNGGKGLKTAFKIAKENYSSDKNNQVILSTDGALNSYMRHGELVKMVKKHSTEIQTSVVTLVGYGYTKKYMKEIVAAGNGHLLPINSSEEAKTMLIREIKTNSIVKE